MMSRVELSPSVARGGAGVASTGPTAMPLALGEDVGEDVAWPASKASASASAVTVSAVSSAESDLAVLLCDCIRTSFFGFLARRGAAAVPDAGPVSEPNRSRVTTGDDDDDGGEAAATAAGFLAATASGFLAATATASGFLAAAASSSCLRLWWAAMSCTWVGAHVRVGGRRRKMRRRKMESIVEHTGEPARLAWR